MIEELVKQAEADCNQQFAEIKRNVEINQKKNRKNVRKAKSFMIT